MLARFEGLELRRLLSAGDVDLSFGLSGVVSGSAMLSAATPYTVLQPVAVLSASGGKAVVVSLAREPLAAFYDAPASHVIAARFNGDGSLDTSFGQRGYAVADFGIDIIGSASAILDGQGRILIAAVGDMPEVTPPGGSLAALRLTAAGKLDTTFSGDGRLQLAFGEFDSQRGAMLAVGADGRILLAATRPDTGEAAQASVVVARLRGDGSLDRTFDGDGKRTIATSAGPVQALTIDSANRPILAGGQYNKIFVARLTTAGAMDKSFAGDGLAHFDQVNGGPFFGSAVSDIVALPDGRTLLSGTVGMPFGPSGQVNDFGFVMRLRGDANRDSKFAGDGLATADEMFDNTMPFNYGEIFPIGDGQIFVVSAQRDTPTSPSRAGIVRVRSNGLAERTFAAGGRQMLPAGLDNQVMISRRGDTTFNVARRGIFDPIAGTTENVGLQVFRLTPKARLDSTYRMTGFAPASEIGADYYNGSNLFVDATGKLVASGLNATGSFVVTRYAGNGKADATFGAGGVSVVGSEATFRNYLAMPTGDGRTILRADGFDTFDNDGIGLMLECLRTDGYLDSNWHDPAAYFYPSSDESTDGSAMILSGGWISASWEEYWADDRRRLVIIEPNGNQGLNYYSTDVHGPGDPTLGGLYFQPDSGLPIGPDAADGYFVVGRAVVNPNESISGGTPLVRRVSGSGELNPVFDGDGNKFNFGGVPVAAQPHGALLYTKPGSRGLFRLNANGAADNSFGSGGIAAAGFDHFDVDSAGRIIAWRQLVGGTADGDIQVMRLTANGKADTTFGGGDGLVTVDTRLSSSGSAPSLLVTPGDDLVVTSLRKIGSDSAKWFASRLIS